MCFRDMTFCQSDCTTTACSRHFGDDDRAAAKRWWGGDDAPVAFSDFSPRCAGYVSAQAIEARQGQDRETGLGRNDESAVAKPCARKEQS